MRSTRALHTYLDFQDSHCRPYILKPCIVEKLRSGYLTQVSGKAPFVYEISAFGIYLRP